MKPEPVRHGTPMESIVREATKNYFSDKPWTATGYYSENRRPIHENYGY